MRALSTLTEDPLCDPPSRAQLLVCVPWTSGDFTGVRSVSSFLPPAQDYVEDILTSFR